MPEGIGYSPKPEGPIEKTQKPATGEHDDGGHALHVEEEAVAHGIDLTPIGGHGQGGDGH